MLKKKSNLHTYTYDGAVMIFNNVAMSSWQGKTMAPSEEKARSNLTYQWKREHGLLATSKVTLPGKINLIN